MTKLDKKFTWNGEKIRTSDEMLPYHWLATLDNYDPTPIDYETPARGIHTFCERGDTEAEAVCNLIERLYEA